MAVDIVIPQAGESVTSGVLSRWLKNEGDFVKRDEPVLELETDKVTMEVPAPAAGVVKHVIKAGETVQIGQRVGSIDETASAASAPASAKTAAASAIAESKPAAAAAVGGSGGGGGGVGVAVAAPPASSGVGATPLAKKLAEEMGVDLSRVKGTGVGNRVREQDVMAFVQSRAANGVPPTSAPPRPTSAPAAPTPAPALRPAGVGVGGTRERMSPLRQRIAARLVQAQHTAAMLTTFNECDMGAVLDLRKQYKEDFEKKHGIGLGFMGFFVKAVVGALRSFPLVNAYLVDDGQGSLAIEKHDHCDIAVAVSTPKGLVVPVLRNCETLSMAAIEQGIKDLATRARDGKLTLEEMQGGTFTITNGGVFGSLMSTPILNPPQSGILGMHTIKNRAIEYPPAGGQIALRPMMYLALSYDHRIIDGAEAVQFLVKVKQAIEDPQRLLLEV